MAPLALSYLQDAIAGTEHPSILDVGPGHGKYGVLMKEYLTPTPQVDAVEAWEPYITDFNLAGIYRHVHHGNVLDLPMTTLGNYHCLFMGDVIEHVSRADGEAFIDRCPTPLVIVTPEHFFSNGPGLPETEKHRSHWTEQDFLNTGRVRRSEVHLGGVLALLDPKPHG